MLTLVAASLDRDRPVLVTFHPATSTSFEKLFEIDSSRGNFDFVAHSKLYTQDLVLSEAGKSCLVAVTSQHQHG